MSDRDPDLTLVKNLEQAGRAWAAMTRIECAGILHIALRYGDRTESTNAYIETLSLASWEGLGRPLQLDVLHTLVRLRELLR